jgi:hypothetical protein
MLPYFASKLEFERQRIRRRGMAYAGFAEIVNCAATARPSLGAQRDIARRGALSLRVGSAHSFFCSESKD